MARIMIVDDDQGVLKSLEYLQANGEHELLVAATAEAALAQFRQQACDVVICNVRLPDASGLELLQQVHQLDPRVPVILITRQGTAHTAIEAIRQGAFEYLLKPLDREALQTVLERAFETVRWSHQGGSSTTELPESESNSDLLVGQCPAMQEVYRQIGRVAGQDVTVLILGESGTGKEVVARAIYQYSRRAHRPFLAINCAAIPEGLLESELFGHEKGAFTGAERRRIGKFEQCDGGTLFLDEIGDMSLLTQTKVLRVLQEQQFERVGGNETIRTNVRLIAATNRNLQEMMEQGTFRSELYYRLNVYTIHLPPLRERHGDLPLLVNHFLLRYARELNKSGLQLAPETWDVLQRYHWPGNIRELQSVLKHAVVETTGLVILPEHLPEAVRQAAASQPVSPASPLPAANARPELPSESELQAFIAERLRAGTENLYSEVLQRVEKTLFTHVLHEVDGNISRAAAILGISRSTLRSKLQTLGISLERSLRLLK